MTINVTTAQNVFHAISDVVQRTSVYASSRSKLEVERLFWLGSGFDSFLASVSATGHFAKESCVIQADSFFDVSHDGRWLLAETDHYVRLREQRCEDAAFLDAELKIAYPGLLSNRNIRPAVDNAVTADEAAEWEKVLTMLGFSLERRYVKRRFTFRSEARFANLNVELEADEFENDPKNGPLAQSAFVSISVETAGSEHRSGHSALEESLAALSSCGIHLVECEGNYEDYYYRRLQLPIT
jgi:adenylate cyclase class IV